MAAMMPGNAGAVSVGGRLGRKGAKGRWKEILGNQAFVIPVIVVFVVLFLIPLVQTIYYSFTDFSGYSPEVSFIGLKNYAQIFSDSSLFTGLAFTLIYAIGTTLLITVLAIPLAVILNRKFFARNFVRSMFFFPAVPSIAVLGMVWVYILSPLSTGVVNSVLKNLFGVGPVPFLSDSTLARLSVILVAVWAGTGWHAMLYLAYLQSIPTEFYEAATIDGASTRQQFTHLTLPMLVPAIVISQFLLMTGGLKVYDLPFTLTGGGPGYSTSTITQGIIVNGIAQGRYGLASALAVLFTIAVTVVVLFQLLASNKLGRRFT